MMNTLAVIPTALLQVQRDWFLSLLAQDTASAAVPRLLQQVEAEITQRSADMAAALAGIVQRPAWSQGTL